MIELANNENKSVQATIRNHKIVSDVDSKLGGDDLGMNPHELLEAALGACTSITIQMYARRKNIQLQDVKMQIHTVSEGTESIITRKIQFIGDLTSEEKQKLLEIANKCPIHRLLESKITIQTESL